jgi:hypothetical protein
LKPWHFVHEPSPSSRGSSAGAHTPRRRTVGSWFRPWPWLRLICSVLSSRARACRRNHQVPRVPLPDVGVTSIRETCTASSEDIIPTDSCFNPVWLSATSAFGLVRGVFLGCYQPLLLPGFSRRYLCESLLRCPSPCPGGLLSAFAWFFPSIHWPSPSFDWVTRPPRSG